MGARTGGTYGHLGEITTKDACDVVRCIVFGLPIEGLAVLGSEVNGTELEGREVRTRGGVSKAA